MLPFSLSDRVGVRHDQGQLVEDCFFRRYCPDLRICSRALDIGIVGMLRRCFSPCVSSRGLDHRSPFVTSHYIRVRYVPTSIIDRHLPSWIIYSHLCHRSTTTRWLIRPYMDCGSSVTVGHGGASKDWKGYGLLFGWLEQRPIWGTYRWRARA